MGLRWLITGGCGFIGTGLVRRLSQSDKCTVRVLDDLSVGTRHDLAAVASPVREIEGGHVKPMHEPDRRSPCELVVGDVLDAGLAVRAAEGADVIVHLAASTGVPPSISDPGRDFAANVCGMFNLLEAARKNGVKRFIFASSGAAVGEAEPPFHEESVPHPVSPYGAGKLAGEGYCSAYFKAFGVETVVLRFSNVYGPGSDRKSSLIAKLIRDVIDGRGWEIHGDGRQTRDFIYVDDLVDAVLKAAVVPGIGGQVFQVATQSETAVGEVAEMIRCLLETKGIEVGQTRHVAARAGDVRRNYADTSKTQACLGWQPRTRLSDGLERTVSWFIEGKRVQPR